MLAGSWALVAPLTLAAQPPAQPGPPPAAAPAPSTATAYPVEGPYGPYSDLVPNSGQLSSTNTPYAGLPRGPGMLPAYVAPPTYAPPPQAPAYVPAYVAPPAPPVSYAPASSAAMQAPPVAPAPPTAVRAPAAAPAPAREVAAAPESEEPADEHAGNPLLGFITEVWAGVDYHDAGIFGRHKEPGADGDMEIRFLPIEFLDFLASPRPDLGLHINSAGATNQVFFGLTWEFWFLKNLFVVPSWGFSVNDDCCLDNNSNNTTTRKQLGSHFLFREALELGWNITGPHNISILVDHVSHGHILASENEGMDSLGLRYGYRF